MRSPLEGEPPRRTFLAPGPRNTAVLELRDADGCLVRAVVFTPDDPHSRRRAVARLRAEAPALGHGLGPTARRGG